VNKKVAIALVILIVFTLLAIIHFNQYPIKNNKKAIEAALAKWVMDPGLNYSQLDQTNIDTVEVKKMQEIDNRTVVFFSYKRDDKEIFAYAKLKKGLNNRFEILSTGHASGKTFLTTNLKTGKNIYRVVMGQNFGKEISSFTLDVDGLKFNSDISKEDYFIRSFQIPQNASPVDKLILYDKDNNNITNEIEKKYPVVDGGGTRTLMEEGIIEKFLSGLIIIIGIFMVRGINRKNANPE